MVKCDDGNLIDGDGCSSKCLVEEGFECYIQASGPDICKDVVLPYGTLSIERGNYLRIKFSERVNSKLDCIFIIYNS